MNKLLSEKETVKELLKVIDGDMPYDENIEIIVNLLYDKFDKVVGSMKEHINEHFEYMDTTNDLFWIIDQFLLRYKPGEKQP